MGITWADPRPHSSPRGGSRLPRAMAQDLRRSWAALGRVLASLSPQSPEQSSRSTSSVMALFRDVDRVSFGAGVPLLDASAPSSSVASSRLFSVAAAGDGPSLRLAREAMARTQQRIVMGVQRCEVQWPPELPEPVAPRHFRK